MQLSKEIITASARSVHATGPHLFWTGTPDESLVKSIEDFGQTTPVLAQETDHGLELIAGQARLRAVLALKLPVLVRMVTDAEALDKGLLYLADNSARIINDAMRLAALRYFQPLMDAEALKSTIMPRLGIKAKSKDATLFLIWLDMPENWQVHLTSGTIPLAAGTVLARMNGDDREALEPLFTHFTWSRSNAVNIITWLFETSKMAGTTVAEVMHRAEMYEILKQGLSPKDAIARLTATAKNIRYPELSALQDRFTKTARELSAGTRWQITQPNNFETGGAELTIQVKNAEQLAKAVHDLETMATLSPWNTLWELGGSNG